MSDELDAIINTVTKKGIWRGQIPIPSSATPMVNSLLQLMQVAGYNGPAFPSQVQIGGVLIDGSTSRPAFTMASPRPGVTVPVGSDATTHGWPVPSGTEYLLASARDASTSYPRSLATSFNAQIQAIW